MWGERPPGMTSFAERLHCDMLTTVLPSVRNVQAWAWWTRLRDRFVRWDAELVHNLPTRGPDGAS